MRVLTVMEQCCSPESVSDGPGVHPDTPWNIAGDALGTLLAPPHTCAHGPMLCAASNHNNKMESYIHIAYFAFWFELWVYVCGA